MGPLLKTKTTVDAKFRDLIQDVKSVYILFLNSIYTSVSIKEIPQEIIKDTWTEAISLSPFAKRLQNFQEEYQSEIYNYLNKFLDDELSSGGRLIHQKSGWIGEPFSIRIELPKVNDLKIPDEKLPFGFSDAEFKVIPLELIQKELEKRVVFFRPLAPTTTVSSPEECDPHLKLVYSYTASTDVKGEASFEILPLNTSCAKYENIFRVEVNKRPPWLVIVGVVISIVAAVFSPFLGAYLSTSGIF